MDNIKKNIIKLFFAFFVIVFGTILVNVLFFNKTLSKDLLFYRVLVLVIIYVFLGVLLYYLYKKIKHKKLLFIISFILFFIMQCIFSSIFLVKPSWDYGVVYNAVIGDVYGTQSMFTNWYFYIYPNNIGLGLFYKLLFIILKLFKFKVLSLTPALVFINILMIDVTILYLYKTIKLFVSKNISMFLLMCTFTITPFITYCPIAYSDTLSMPFVMISVYLFAKYFLSNKENRKHLILSGVFLGVGSMMKFSVAILLISYLIFLIFDKKTIQTKFISACILALCFLVSYSPVKMAESFFMNQTMLYRESYPITHWIMMGLNEDDTTIGGYFLEDAEYTTAYEGIDNKKEKNMIIIRQRLSDYVKRRDLVSFWLRKATYTWGDGTLYAPNKLALYPENDYEIQKIVTGSKKETFFYRVIAQGQLVLIRILMILAVIFNKYLSDKQKKLLFLCSVTIFGIFLFFTIWETRSRYLMNFLPILIIQSYLGGIAVYNKVKTIVKRKKV